MDLKFIKLFNMEMKAMNMGKSIMHLPVHDTPYGAIEDAGAAEEKVFDAWKDNAVDAIIEPYDYLYDDKDEDEVKIVNLKDDIQKRVGNDNGDYQNLYAVGNNRFGQLSNGTTENIKLLTLMDKFPKDIKIKNIIFGHNGSPWFLTKDGDLYGCGQNEYGMLGFSLPEKKGDNNLIYTTPQRIKTPSKVYSISTGISSLHRYILTSDSLTSDSLYGIGRNECKQIGIESTKSYYFCEKQNYVDKFMPIDHFVNNGISIKKIECGLNFTIFLSESGDLYCHGFVNLAEITTLNDEIAYPNRINKMNSIDMIIDVGCTQEDVLAVNNEGKVYCWYNGSFYDDEFELKTEFIDNNVSITKVCCGSYHSVYLDSKGKVYVDNDNSNYFCQNGNGDTFGLIALKTEINQTLQAFCTVDIKCGSDHCLAKTNTDDFYLWGANDYNQCLLYDDKDKVPIPTKYNCDECTIIDMYLGWKETIVITEND